MPTQQIGGGPKKDTKADQQQGKATSDIEELINNFILGPHRLNDEGSLFLISLNFIF